MTTPPLSIDEKPLDLDEEPINLDFNTMPNLSSLTRQVTDKAKDENNSNNIKQEIPTEDDSKITKEEDQSMPAISDLSLGSLARQQTDYTQNNAEHEHEPKSNDNINENDPFKMAPLPDLGLSGLVRQTTDVTSHDNNNINTNTTSNDNDIEDINTEQALDIAMGPLPDLSGLLRQQTDITPNEENPTHNASDDDKEDTEHPLDIAMGPLPDLSGLTRQQTDINPNANPNDKKSPTPNDNADDLDMPKFNDLMLSGLTRQRTDQHDNDQKSPSPNINTDDVDNADDLDMPKLDNLFLSGLTRQKTDIHNQGQDTHDSHSDDDNKGDADNPGMAELGGAALPDLSGLTRQQTDVTMNNENEDNKNKEETPANPDDIGGDAFMSLSLPNLHDIARQKTDASEVDISNDNDNERMMMDQMRLTKSEPLENKMEEEIKFLPPRVPSIKDLVGDETEVVTSITDNPQQTSGDNQYLDQNLLHFDSKGKLLDIENEQFIHGIKDDIQTNMENEDGDETPQEIEDDSLNQFIEHTEPIICLAFNPQKNYEVISGGQDENCFIWDIINYDSTSTSMKVDKPNDEEKKDNDKQIQNDTDTNKLQQGYFKISNHKDTVIDCAWNSSGKYLATASMDSTIQIYNCNKNMKLVSSLDIGQEISFIEWHPNIKNDKKYRNILMTGAFDKNLWIYQYNKQLKQFQETQILSGHSAEIECGGFTKFNDGKYGYSGDKDGMIIIWENIIDCDPYSGKKKHSFKPLESNDNTDYYMAKSGNIGLYHESGINCMDDCRTAPLLISGSSDYSVCLINYENGKILQKLGKHADSVESVQFNKLYKQEIKYTNYASSSSLDGVIKIWDLNTSKIRNELNHDDGVVCHEWFNTEKNSNLIVSGCMDGIIYIWDSRNAKSIKQLRGHGKCIIQSLKITNDDKYIVSAGDDSIAMVWKI